MSMASVILPCFNGARWIDRAIQSILAQTCKNFELVIIDDGSEDNSKEIIAEYLYDGRVRYIYQTNRGFSAALNRGIKESNGCLIGFIGQDDLWMPNKLELQKKFLGKHPDVDLVHSNYYSIDPQERIMRMVRTKVNDFSSKQEVIKWLFLITNLAFETVLLKRKCFDKVGLFDERMVGYSDHDMWLRIAGSFNIDYLDVPLVKKRQHELQLSIVRREEVLKDEFLLARKIINQYPFLKRFELRKLAPLYYEWGIALVQAGNIKGAKEKLLKAIRCRPSRLKATFAYMAPRLYIVGLFYYQRLVQTHSGSARKFAGPKFRLHHSLHTDVRRS